MPAERTLRRLAVAFAACCALWLIGCSSQERLTGKQIGCRTGDVKILKKSEFARRGVTTAWCAECKGDLYTCASNADRTRTECHKTPSDEMCR